MHRGVPITGRAEPVARVVQVHQVDPSGDRPDPVHDALQGLSRREGVTGVQAEADVELTDGVPQPGERIEPARHGVVPTRGVLHQDPGAETTLGSLPLEHLAPVRHALGRVLALGDVPAVHDQAPRPDRRRPGRVLGQRLARRDADAVVQRGHVEHVGRMHVDLEATAGQLPCLGVLHGHLPTLRVGQEELHDLGVQLGCRGDRVVVADVGPDAHEISPGPVAASHRAVEGGDRRALRTTRSKDLRRLSGVTSLTYRRHVQVQLVVSRLEAQ